MPLKAQDMQVDGTPLVQQAYDAYRDALRRTHRYTRSVRTWEALSPTTREAWAVAVNRVLELTAGFNA
jgi:hypothetical protein